MGLYERQGVCPLPVNGIRFFQPGNGFLCQGRKKGKVRGREFRLLIQVEKSKDAVKMERPVRFAAPERERPLFGQKLLHRSFAGQPRAAEHDFFSPVRIIGKLIKPGVVAADLAEEIIAPFQHQPAQPFFCEEVAVSLFVHPKAGESFFPGFHPFPEFLAQRPLCAAVFFLCVFINIDFLFLAARMAAPVRLALEIGEKGGIDFQHNGSLEID